MPIKDSVLAWFVREYVIPNAQVLDKPGFVIFNISGKTPIRARQVIVPEQLFVNIENECIDKLGDNGKKLLYSAGKKFGYGFAIMGGFITKKESDKKKFIEYVMLVNKFIEGTYASLIDGHTEYEKSMVTFFLRNFVVCNKTGHGYFLPLGAGTGLVARLMGDTAVEGIHIVNGKYSECTVVCAPKTILEKEYPESEILDEVNLSGLEPSAYYSDLNKVAEISSSSHSFRKYLETGLFSYDHGIVMYKNDRYFIFEASGLYLLSDSLEGAGAGNILFDGSFKAGKETIESFRLDKNNIQSLVDIFSAFGWGDVIIHKQGTKVEISIKHFPWTKFSKDSKFTIFKGYFSGILSGFSGRTIILSNMKENINSGYLEVIFSE